MPSHTLAIGIPRAGLAWFTAAALVMISAVPFKSQHKNTTMTTSQISPRTLCTDFEIMDVNVSTLMLTPRRTAHGREKKAESARQ